MCSCPHDRYLSVQAKRRRRCNADHTVVSMIHIVFTFYSSCSNIFPWAPFNRKKIKSKYFSIKLPEFYVFEFRMRILCTQKKVEIGQFNGTFLECFYFFRLNGGEVQYEELSILHSNFTIGPLALGNSQKMCFSGFDLVCNGVDIDAQDNQEIILHNN